MFNKKINKKVIITSVCVLMFSSFALAGCKNETKKSSNTNVTSSASKKETKEFRNFAKKLGEEIKKHWPYMDKVWPGYNYKNHNVVFFNISESGSIKEAWLINADGSRKLSDGEYTKITPPQPGGYDKISFEGKPSISISADEKSIKEDNALDNFYRITTHEIVHFYYQKEATNNFDVGNRYQEYPLDKTPRLYRKMVYKNLIEAYENPTKENESLGKAKYWLDKWKKEFSQEYKDIKSTDIVESTARYTENIGSFITDKLTKEEFEKNAKNNIKKNEDFLSADSESYEIGYVAALILDNKSPNWKNNFYKEGMTVEEKLLENVKEIPEKPDSEVEKRINKTVDQYNKTTAKSIEDIIKSEKDKKIPYLRLDINKSESSLASSGMLKYNGKNVIEEYINGFKVGDKSIKIDRKNVIDVMSENGSPIIEVPLDIPYEYKSGILTIKSEKLTVEGIKAVESNDNGRKILSIVVDK